jgi:hypothetical protein
MPTSKNRAHCRPEPEAELARNCRNRRNRARTNEFNDDRDVIRPDDRVVLMVENDPTFASLLLEAAREAGMKGIATSRGAAAVARQGNIQSAGDARYLSA